MKYGIMFIISALTVLTGCVNDSSMNIPAVKNFVPEKYLGKWYEFARLPNSFEKGMSNCYAVYSPRRDGKIGVLNCGMKNKKLKCVKAVARTAIPGTGELEVSFFRPFYGKYRIIKLAPDYSYAVVTGADKSYLWILSRTETPDKKSILEIMDFLRYHNYPVEKLIYPQSIP